MERCVAIAMLLISSSFAPTTDSDKQLIGDWEVTEHRAGDKETPGIVGSVWTFGMESLSMRRKEVPSNRKSMQTYKLTPDDPKKDDQGGRIDIKSPAGMLKGIYKLDGDSLTIAISENRPTDYKPEDGKMFIVLKRISVDKSK